MLNPRALLVLGRVSNLSTVWSNCLCAWMLGGGGELPVFAALILSLSLTYVGGMYMNDVCDVDFDRRYRPERPIPSGVIQRKTVLIMTLLLHGGGLAMVAWMGFGVALYGLLLLSLVVLYNLIHKKTVLGVFFMAGCRAGVYLLAGAASAEGVTPEILWAGGLMFVYTLGVTVLARTESRGDAKPLVGMLFLLAPLGGAAYLASRTGFSEAFFVSALLLLGWFCIVFLRARTEGKWIIGKTIGPLLAGMCLIDLVIVSSTNLFSLMIAGALLAFFIVALLAQRRIPAS